MSLLHVQWDVSKLFNANGFRKNPYPGYLGCNGTTEELMFISIDSFHLESGLQVRTTKTLSTYNNSLADRVD